MAYLLTTILALLLCVAEGRQVDFGPYTVDYHSGCGAGIPITYEEAQAWCKIATPEGRGGPDWNLATIPSQAAYDGLRDAIGSTSLFLGAKYDSTDGKWKWQFGRLAGVEIFSGLTHSGSCLSTSYKFPTYLDNVPTVTH